MNATPPYRSICRLRDSDHGMLAVVLADLVVEGPHVVEIAEEEESTGNEPEEAGEPLAHVEAVDAKDAEEHLEEPGDGVIQFAGCVFEVGLAIHGRDEEKVNNPANEQEAAGEKPDGSADRFAIVKAVRAGEADDPEEVSDDFAVGVPFDIHIHLTTTNTPDDEYKSRGRL